MAAVFIPHKVAPVKSAVDIVAVVVGDGYTFNATVLEVTFPQPPETTTE